MSRAWVVSLLAIVAGGLFLAGCWSQSEVNNLAIITVAALDRTPEGEYRWTVIAPVPEQVTPPPLSGGSGTPSRTATDIRTGSGPTPVMAAEELEVAIPREVRWTHADHILIGEQAARAGLRPVLEFASRRYQIERRSALYVTRGEAGMVLDQFHPALERSLARTFDEVSRSRRPGSTPAVDANTFLRSLGTPGLDPHLPVLTVKRQPGAVIPASAGVALFRKDRLAGFLEPPADRGLLLMRGEVPPFTVLVPCPGEQEGGKATAAFRVTRAMSRVRAEGGAGGPRGQVRIGLQADVFEWNCKQDLHPESVDEAARQAAAEIRRETEMALKEIRRLGVDPVGFGAALHRSDPQAWRSIAREWRSMLTRLPVTVDVRFRVRGYQLTESAP